MESMVGIKLRHRGEVVLSKKTREGGLEEDRERGQEEIWVDTARGRGGE